MSIKLLLIVIKGMLFSLGGIIRGYREFQFRAFSCTASVSSLVYDHLLSLAFGISILCVFLLQKNVVIMTRVI